MKYEEAIKKLEDIVGRLESGQLGIDELTEKVKEASELIDFCRKKLYKTEKEVNDLFESKE